VDIGVPVVVPWVESSCSCSTPCGWSWPLMASKIEMKLKASFGSFILC